VWRRSDAGAVPWAGGGGASLVRSCGRRTHGASVVAELWVRMAILPIGTGIRGYHYPHGKGMGTL
jgi:hypothetical protein